ncbi:hypothetical protein GCM10020255_072180 [Rhodococcus baikonurensis]
MVVAASEAFAVVTVAMALDAFEFSVRGDSAPLAPAVTVIAAVAANAKAAQVPPLRERSFTRVIRMPFTL